MATLFDALLETARLCGIVRSGTSTSDCGATTMVDTTRLEDDDFFEGGTLLFQSSLYAGMSTKITDFSRTTGTFTFIQPGTAGSGTGPARYSASVIDRDSLIDAVNTALSLMGGYLTTDNTLTVASNQLKYTLPTGVSNLFQVGIEVDSTYEYGYNPSFYWHEIDGELVFDYILQDQVGHKIMLAYEKRHAALTTDADVIHPAYNMTRLSWVARYAFLQQRFQISGNYDGKEPLMLQETRLELERLAMQYPVNRYGKHPHLTDWTHYGD